MTQRSEQDKRPEIVHGSKVVKALDEVDEMLFYGCSEAGIRRHLSTYGFHPRIVDQIIETAKERGRL